MEFKLCQRCNLEKLLIDFSKKGSYYRRICKKCYNETITAKDNKKQSDKRKNPQHYAYFIVKDSKKNDKKLNRSNDLTIEFVNSKISEGCCSCGTKELRISLDRIDNNQGHTQNNTVPACMICNFIRRNMPYKAWVKFFPVLKEIQANKLFGEWTGTFYDI